MSGDDSHARGAGVIALVGGAEWTAGAEIDEELLELSGANEVVVLPTAAAFERPERAVETATKWFAGLGVPARGLMVLRHEDALSPEVAGEVGKARFVYLAGGSPLHLRSVLAGTPLFDSLVQCWRSGGVVAGSSAGAMVLGDPMVDPRGGAFTVGLGLVEQLAVVPHFRREGGQLMWRTLELAPKGVRVVGIPEATALVLGRDGGWRALGASSGDVTVFLDGERRDLSALSG